MQTIRWVFPITTVWIISLLVSPTTPVCAGSSSETTVSDAGLETDARNAGGEITPGILYKKIVSKSNDKQSYALYLPHAYGSDPQKYYPIVYGFCPQGRGVELAQLLQNAADKHDCIVAISNAVCDRRKWGELRLVIEGLLADTQTRFKVDTQREYACGLLAGARVSFLLSEMHASEVAGVIAYDGGYHRANFRPRENVLVYAMTGTQDMNYKEVSSLAVALGWPDNPNIQFSEFNGRDQCPPQAKFEEALDWMFSK